MVTDIHKAILNAERKGGVVMGWVHKIKHRQQKHTRTASSRKPLVSSAQCLLQQTKWVEEKTLPRGTVHNVVVQEEEEEVVDGDVVEEVGEEVVGIGTVDIMVVVVMYVVVVLQLVAVVINRISQVIAGSKFNV